ncbi:glycosyltransferase family A protein [Flavobacteriaceae bacterium SZ-1-7]|uniref:glycosyltransferase family 2 protein n=1 Tax=Tamlana sedimenti TaxID=3134126 RepID=UPI0031270734
MILLTHTGEKVVDIVDLNNNKPISIDVKNPAKALLDLAKNYQERILIWAHTSQKENINIEGVKASFYLKNMMLSFSNHQYLPEQIGYVEDSPFLKVNKKVKYPTWLMSSNVGAIHASQLLKFENKVKLNLPFDFVLNSMAKLGMPNGLFCYSEPKLLLENNIGFNLPKASTVQLFMFVKQHYKGIWSLLFPLNFMVFEKRFPILTFIRTILVKKHKFSSNFDLQPLEKQSQNIDNITIDVIIPTLGRKAFLHDVLLDLEKQTLLPQQVIIIEQNEDENSTTELNFISNKTWPFKIVHKFIHQTGACNARNLALKEVISDYVFFADDDIRFPTNFIEVSLYKMRRHQFDAVTLSCLQKKDKKTHLKPIQWSTFGSGCSIVKSECLKNLTFDMNYEFGFGEDADFGMQLRKKGIDIIYLHEPEIEHLKAPIGGFRKPHEHIWAKYGDKPKPSPTITFYKLMHQTKKQLKGYKMVLFFKFYLVQSIKNPFKYYKTFKKQWRQSVYWANQMIDK